MLARLFLSWALVFLCAMSAGAEGFRLCGWRDPAAPEPRLREDGKIAVFARAPGAALLAMHRDGVADPAYCGATLIAPDWVLTARHCVDTKIWQSLEVELGAAVIGRRGVGVQRFGQVALCPAGTFPGNFAKDYALVRLARAVPSEVTKAVIASVPGSAENAPEMTLAHWRARHLGRLLAPLSLTRVQLDGIGPEGMWFGTPLPTGEPSPCGGESGSALLAGGDDTPLVVALLSAILPDPRDDTRASVCQRPRTRMLLTPVGGLGGWIDSVITACTKQPESCAIVE